MDDATRAEMDASAILPHLIPRTKNGLPKIAVTRAEAADLCGCSPDLIKRIPASQLPIIDGQPARYMLADLVLYLERKRRTA